jgi:hypothetical protein
MPGVRDKIIIDGLEVDGCLHSAKVQAVAAIKRTRIETETVIGVSDHITEGIEDAGLLAQAEQWKPKIALLCEAFQTAVAATTADFVRGMDAARSSFMTGLGDINDEMAKFLDDHVVKPKKP